MFYISMPNVAPSSLHFNDDRSYIINGGDPSDDPPEWLDAVFGRF